MPEPAFDYEVLAFDITMLINPRSNASKRGFVTESGGAEKVDAWQFFQHPIRLLRISRERPSHRRHADQCDEIAPRHATPKLGGRHRIGLIEYFDAAKIGIDVAVGSRVDDALARTF